MCLTSSQLQPPLFAPSVPAEATTQESSPSPQRHQELMMNGENLSVFVQEEKHLSGMLCTGSAEAADHASLHRSANHSTTTQHNPGDPFDK